MHQQQRAKWCLLPADTISLGGEDRFLGKGKRQNANFGRTWGTTYKYENYFQINKTSPWNQGQPLKWELFCKSIPKPRKITSNASTGLCSEMPLLFECEKQDVNLHQANTKQGALTNLYTSNEEQVCYTMGSNCYFYLEKWIATFSVLKTLPKVCKG